MFPPNLSIDERSLRIGCLKPELVETIEDIDLANDANKLQAVKAMAANSSKVPKPRKTRPTSGLLAFFALLHACSHLDLYGFTGLKAGDGHLISLTAHNIDKEHEIIDHIARLGHIEDVVRTRGKSAGTEPSFAKVRVIPV